MRNHFSPTETNASVSYPFKNITYQINNNHHGSIWEFIQVQDGIRIQF